MTRTDDQAGMLTRSSAPRRSSVTPADLAQAVNTASMATTHSPPWLPRLSQPAPRCRSTLTHVASGVHRGGVIGGRRVGAGRALERQPEQLINGQVVLHNLTP